MLTEKQLLSIQAWLQAKYLAGRASFEVPTEFTEQSAEFQQHAIGWRMTPIPIPANELHRYAADSGILVSDLLHECMVRQWIKGYRPKPATGEWFYMIQHTVMVATTVARQPTQDPPPPESDDLPHPRRSYSDRELSVQERVDWLAANPQFYDSDHEKLPQYTYRAIADAFNAAHPNHKLVGANDMIYAFERLRQSHED